MYAAQIAGPAALLSWIGAGVLCALIALVMIELGATRPEGGGTVRWPLYANGRLVGTVIGWSGPAVGGRHGGRDSPRSCATPTTTCPGFTTTARSPSAAVGVAVGLRDGDEIVRAAEHPHANQSAVSKRAQPDGPPRRRRW